MPRILTVEVPHEGEAGDAPSQRQPVRAVGYLRASTPQQDRHAKSLDAQEKEVRDYARGEGFSIGAVFRDVLSGRADRYEFNQLLDVVDRGEVDVVVTWEVSRFGRDGFSNALLAHKCREQHVRIEVATGGKYELDDPFDKFVFGILSQLAEYERDLILIRLARGKEHGHDRGCWVEGIPPFGYTTMGSKGDRRLVPTAEAPLVPEIFERYIAGESTYKIANSFRAMGVADNLSKGKSAKWCPDTIGKILDNANYVGLLTFGGKTVRGQYESLVSQDLYDAARRRRAEQRRRHPGRPPSNSQV